MPQPALAAAPDPAAWTAEEVAVQDTLRSPPAIQAFLDATPYSTEPIYRCPRSVQRDRRAHCFGGAVLAAAALRRLGHPPLIVDLRAHRDDDHVLAIYRREGFFGCVSKSNVALLRYREPVFRSLRELVMSYFEVYFNLDGDKALREYSRPVDLRRWDRAGWQTDDCVMAAITARLDAVKHAPLLTPSQIANLAPTDERTYAACLLGADEGRALQAAAEGVTGVARL